jgi:hypothetical protein
VLTQIDHLVIISPDLDSAVAKVGRSGFTSVRGGTHADGLTENALIAFADGSYIELISPTRPDMQADHRWFARLRHGGGLVDYCLLSDDLGTDLAAMRERGVDYIGPSALGRNRPDGVRIDWVLGLPPGNVGGTGWPFLIEDVTPRSERVPHDEHEISHANGATGIAGVTVLVHNLDSARRDYQTILGSKATEIPSPVGGGGRAVQLTVGTAGTQWIVLVQPLSGEQAWRSEALGQGPYAATLRTHEGDVSPRDGTPIEPPLHQDAHLLLA